MNASEIYLVRHGEYDHFNGDLIEAGIEQARNARDELVAKDLGNTTLLLASTHLRTVQTAEIIAEGLGLPVLASDRLKVAGYHPEAMRSMEDFLSETFAQEEIEYNDEAIVLVTHGQLIATVTGLSTSHLVEAGGVYEYQPGSWTNKNYNRRLAELFFEDPNRF